MAGNVAQRPVTGCGEVNHPVQHLRPLNHQRQITGPRGHRQQQIERAFAGCVGERRAGSVGEGRLYQPPKTLTAGRWQGARTRVLSSVVLM